MPRPRNPRRCTAKSKRTGKRCKNAPVKGATVCRMHGAGGDSPAATKAKQNVAIEQAQRMVARAGVDLDPLTHLVDCLHQAAQLAAVWGLMVAALDAKAQEEAEASHTLRGSLSYSREEGEADSGGITVSAPDRLVALNRGGFATVHPFVTQLERAIERRARFAKLCVDAGVEQARVEIEQQRAQLVADVFRKVFEDPKLGLSEKQRKAGLRSAASHLRLIAGGG